MADIIQLRRDTAANWASANPILAQGEPGIELDTDNLKWGDGSTAWNSLNYAISRNRVWTTKTDVFTTTTTGSWIDVTGLSLSITPSSDTKKIRALAVIKCGGSSAAFLRLVRGSSAIGVGDTAGSRTPAGTSDLYDYYARSDKIIAWIDDPMTNSEITYKVQCFLASSGTLRVGAMGSDDADTAVRGRFAQFFELQEID
jgi:hypothetical protein